MTIEVTFQSHDNTIDLTLKEDASAVDLSSVTRATLTFAGITLDSAVNAGVFDWSAGSGLLSIAMGTVASVVALSAGTYRARLVIYDPTNTNGIVWVDDLPIRIIA